jgi:hypothetical protein
MTFPRFAYRARQFWNALLKPEKQVSNEAVLKYLSASQLILFRRMQPSEQYHACQVLEDLQKAGQSNPNLLAAALLHDVGKILSPLSLFDRIAIVIGTHLFPLAAKRWGQGMARGWRRAFVVAACHAEWGADLVQQAGASPITTELVRRHTDPPIKRPVSHLERLLVLLQMADDGN